MFERQKKKNHKNSEIKQRDEPTKWCVSTFKTHKISLLVPRNPSIDKIYRRKYLSAWMRAKKEVKTWRPPCLWFHCLSEQMSVSANAICQCQMSLFWVRESNKAICIKLSFTRKNVCLRLSERHMFLINLFYPSVALKWNGIISIP